MHLLEIMNAAEKAAGDRIPQAEVALTSTMFAFQTEERLFCSESNRVRYKTGRALVLELGIPLEMAVNKREVNEYKDRQMKRQKLRESGADAEISIEQTNDGDQKVTEITRDDEEVRILPKVPFSACLSNHVGDMVIEDYYCRQLKRRTQAIKSAKIKTFPPFLMIQLKRYYLTDTWEVKKMEVLVEAPDDLILESLRAPPHDPEEDVASDSDEEKNTGPVADAALVQQLKAMDFPENGCIKAAIAVNNQSLEAATDWILTHLNDPGFNDPIKKSTDREPNPEAVSALTSMGFAVDACKAALIETNNDVDAAVGWLIDHAEKLGTMGSVVLDQEPSNAADVFLDGEGHYELVGFISHMGKSTLCGHYVCHIKKNGRWILFNDEKVAISESPPKEFGYMYLYKRKDVQGVVE